MRFEKIILHGFKSFAEKTELQILPGITAIVGPNGCGKSNIAEAVRWALGEQSPKALRGHRMEDVIFHGSASRKPLGMAEASLVFANDGSLPVPWSEVQVTRRLYRTDESEYLLNNTPCRLRDIQDLLVGTGVNPKAYALMDQERLNLVLTAKPLDRRIFIEEAAGISRYKQHRAETLGKLEAARQNLGRAKDVMGEVKRQLGSLERQARKAQEYKALQAEKQSLELSFLAAEHTALLAQERALAQRINQLRELEAQVRARLSGLAAREATERAATQASEHRLSDLRQAVQKAQGEVERLLERREQITLQRRELDEAEARLREEIRLIEERRAAVTGERETKAHLLEESLDGFRRRRQEVEELTARLEALRQELRSARDQLEALRLEQVRIAGERSEVTRSAGAHRERGDQLQRRRERLIQELESSRVELAQLAERRAALEEEHARVRAALSGFEAERRRLEAALAACEAQRGDCQVKLAHLRLALASRQSSLEALERLEQEREGYGEGVRVIFSAPARASVHGVVGTVADLLEVPSGLERAVEAVLGERLTWVVVERFEDAKAVLAYLAQHGAGPATFLPLDTLSADNGLPEDQNGLQWAVGLVGSPYATLLRYLLGQVAVVADLAAAETFWRRNGSPATYVTRSGEVLADSGWLSGGRANQKRSFSETSLLGRKRAIRDAREEMGQLAREVSQAEAHLERAEEELRSLRERHAGLVQKLGDAEVRSRAAEQALAQAIRDEERLSQHLGTVASEDRQLLDETAEVRRALEDLEREASVAREQEGALARASGELRQRIERFESEEGELIQTVTTAQVAWASLGERVEALKRELSHFEEAEHELATRLAQAHARRAEMAARKAELELEHERMDHLAREAAAERDRLEAEERATAQQHQGLLDGLREIDSLIRSSEHESARSIEELHALELQATEGRVRREELEQEARRRFAVEPDVLSGHHATARPPDSLRARLAELEGALATLGPVNLVADDEYRELEERLSFLRTQHDDLVASIKDLEKALRGMTRTAQARFLEAFEAINRHFGEIFSRLFEGGQAELRLVPPEEGEESPLEIGVELLAQPRGKRLQSVTLLSGGEKALTGLALLFAIFYYRPSPFCVLDEVDAPLDDANIHRFLRVLRELCRHTQFIVITHNRKTMEAADVLYGITMEEPGLSRLVSVKLVEDRA